MKISEIEIDDSQTGYYWIQIYVKNKKEAISLRRQILKDQAIRERLEDEIKRSKYVVKQTSSSMEMAIQNFLLERLQYVLEGSNEET